MAKGKLAGLWAFWRFMKSRDSGVSLKLLALAAALYVILPTDFVPDVIPFAGWLDDIGVLTLVTTFLAGRYAKEKRDAAENAADVARDAQRSASREPHRP